MQLPARRGRDGRGEGEERRRQEGSSAALSRTKGVVCGVKGLAAPAVLAEHLAIAVGHGGCASLGCLPGGRRIDDGERGGRLTA